jgi:hypothetical protein
MSDPLPTVDGYGTRLYYGVPNAATTELEGITELTPPAIEVAEVETSHMTTADRTRTFKGGWRDPGSVSGKMHFDPSRYSALLALVGEAKGFKVELADGSMIEFNGFIKSVGNPIDREGLVSVEFTIRVSGKPTFTAGAGV